MSLLLALTATAGSDILDVPLYANSPILYSETISIGGTSLTSTYITNTTLLYTGSVVLGSIQVVEPIFTNTSLLYAPALSIGAYSITSTILSNTSTYNIPVVSIGSINLGLPYIGSTLQYFTSTVFKTEILIPTILTNNNELFVTTIYQYQYSPTSGYILTNKYSSNIITLSNVATYITKYDSYNVCTKEDIDSIVSRPLPHHSITSDGTLKYINSTKVYYN